MLVAICLLISAGTFLYVATMHVLPEVYTLGAHSHDHDLSEELVDEHKHEHEHEHEHEHGKKSTKILDTALLVVGALIPVMLCIFLDEHGH